MALNLNHIRKIIQINLIPFTLLTTLYWPNILSPLINKNIMKIKLTFILTHTKLIKVLLKTSKCLQVLITIIRRVEEVKTLIPGQTRLIRKRCIHLSESDNSLYAIMSFAIALYVHVM